MKLYRVYDGDGFIGSYRARSPEHAIQRAKDEQAAAGATFRRSQPGIMFKNPRAEEVKP